MSPISLRRDVAALEGSCFDLAVVGGGIVGACVARDAARRGLSVALIDKGDFSGGTSASSSKLVHGGLRYLRGFELRLVREAMRERRLWARNAPHLVRPMPFLLPLGAGRGSQAAMRAALTLYDLLAFDKGRIDDPHQRAPGHRRVGTAEARAMEPALGDGAAYGAILYYDYQMESPERLGLECVIDAVAHGAVAANYVAMTGFLRDGSGKLAGVAAKDRIGGGETEIRAKMVVNATGPWADRVAALGMGQSAPFAIRRSKGIHLVARAFLRGHALAVTGKGRHLFAVPWRSRTLIGTTDTAYDGDPDGIQVYEEEEADLLEAFNAMLPGAGVTDGDIVHRYAGVRPLIGHAEKGGETYGLSREAEVVEHEESGGPANLISAIGGKWTTSRHIAEQVVDKIAARLGVRLRPCDTAEARLPLAPAGTIAEHEAEMEAALAGLDEKVKAQLMRSYGNAAGKVLRAAAGDPALLAPLAPDVPHMLAEAAYAVRHEMAVRPNDILFRRTSIAPLGGASPAVRARIARVLE